MDRRTLDDIALAVAPAVKASVTDAVAKATAPLLERIAEIESRTPLKGDPGIDGKDGAPGLDGKDGVPGLPGKDGEPGPHPTTESIVEAIRAMPEFAELVKAETAARFAENPPKDGEAGDKGDKGDEGEPGRDGRDGLPGLSGQKGADGIDGKDGLGFDDLDVVFDGERTVTFKFARGEVVKEWPVKFPMPIDRGVYRPERDYEKGDGVTFGGSFFIAQRDTSDKPETSDAWRLSVKRGQNGKDARVLPTDPTPPVRLK